jgi:hypothetical protein
MKRRRFLANSLVAASSLYSENGFLLSLPVPPQERRQSSKKVTLESRHLRLECDLQTGRISLYQGTPDRPLLLDATAAVGRPNSTILASDPSYTRTSYTGVSRDPGIEGDRLVVKCTSSAIGLGLEWRWTLLKDRAGAVSEMVVTNTSSKDALVLYAEPLRSLLDESSGCFFGAEAQYTRVGKTLTQGYLYYDPGELVDFAWRSHREVVSYWNSAFYLPDSEEALIVGYLENDQAEGQIIASWDMTREYHGGQASFNLTARSFYNRYFVLKPGASISSGRVLTLLCSDPFAGLEFYADTYGHLHQVRLNPIINGWCSWFYTHTQATEEEQLRNAQFIAKYLKPYGMEWVQIDDGFQRSFGDWEGNQLYPHGMKWLAAKIRELGLKPGIWVAPTVISEDTEIARKHAEWLVHDADGEVQTVANPRAKYALDITHPGARRWVHELFKRISGEWGYDFIKIDFVEWSILAAQRYYDATVSKAQAYRMLFETIRAAIGSDRHLLDCGPGPVTVGLLDSMRIELDLPHLTWDQYAKNFNSNAPAMAKRYYFHKRIWINDADHLGLALLTVPQAQAAASIIALSGGTMISGDRLYQLDPARLEILKKVLPAYGEAARPIDLFEKSFPEIFVLKIQKNFGDWWLVGFFNWDENATTTRDLELARVGADAQKTYLAYEFWTQRLVAEGSRILSLKFDPSSVNLLAIREKREVPQVLGTDRHYTQGALELEDVKWEAATRTLSGVGLGAPGTAWRLSIHIPGGYQWDSTQMELFHDSPGLSAISTEKHILQAHLEFQDTNRIPWSFKFNPNRSG